MATIKASESANSLSGLVDPDPRCYFCHHEAGHDEELVDAKKFLVCNCKFVTHTSCWNTHIFEKKEHKCPICDKTVGRIYVVAESETRIISGWPCKSWKTCFYLTLAIGVIFVAGFVVGMILNRR
jgi:hypothetical protein